MIGIEKSRELLIVEGSFESEFEELSLGKHGKVWKNNNLIVEMYGPIADKIVRLWIISVFEENELSASRIAILDYACVKGDEIPKDDVLYLVVAPENDYTALHQYTEDKHFGKHKLNIDGTNVYIYNNDPGIKFIKNLNSFIENYEFDIKEIMEQE